MFYTASALISYAIKPPTLFMKKLIHFSNCSCDIIRSNLLFIIYSLTL
jgi:hypothetical protein